jgi:protoheme IX farnesyltransferase
MAERTSFGLAVRGRAASAGTLPTCAAAGRRTTTASRVADYVELTKPRVVVMVLLTTAVGFYLGSTGVPAPIVLLHTLVGTALAAGGTLALNQYLERDLDARMQRTRCRPIPAGRIGARQAAAFGVLALLLGLGHLTFAVGSLAASVTAAIAVTYLLLYTPLKRVTPLNAIVGAVPGALPPVVGWAAARGALAAEPLVLFGIMFLWQIPHSLAIARVYRDDYARAGIRMLPVVDPGGRSTGVHAVSNCLALLPVALLPTLLGLAGPVYFLVALLLGALLLVRAIGLARAPSVLAARRLLNASLVYLPVLLGVMALDKLGS